MKGTAWVTDIEFRVNPPRVREKKNDQLFAFLGSAEKMDGESELYRVGRCLNHQYPHDLDRVSLRDREVAELSRLLKASDRRPVLLLGNRQSGKTAILHEYVFRHVTKVGNPHRDKEAVWLLSSQRLISGMSYVGQWESRFHAIIKHAVARELILYFDDPLGLFQAGVTSQSTLNVAALLSTVLEQRSVRVVGEMTPEEFRVLREKDRSFAYQFHIIRVEELTGDENLKVLFGLQRQLELRHHVRFSIDALPVVVDLQRRHARDVAFPEKSSVFMKRLAVRAEGETNVVSDTGIARIVDHAADAPGQISRHRVLDVFHQQSGLPRSFLDQQTTLCAEELEKSLRELNEIDGVLCIESLQDLLRTGGREATDSIASFCIPYLQRGELRLVAEVTPTELDACRRLLPGLVDLFQVVTLQKLHAPRAERVLNHVAEHFASSTRLTIAGHASTHAVRLFERFHPYHALPGEVVSFWREHLDRYARSKTHELQVDSVQKAFLRRTGLPEQFLQDDLPMTRGSVLSHFASEIIEQTAACEAATDVAIQFKAGMNDPRRPLGVLLFCGPTGVGKTELAKSMSRFLFGASGGEISSSGVTSETATKPESPRMIRLDMSEYAGPWAADRLLMQSNGNHRTSCSRFVASRLRCCCWMRSRKLIRLFTTC